MITEQEIKIASDFADSIQERVSSSIKWKRGKAGGTPRQKEFATQVTAFMVPALAARKLLSGASEDDAKAYADLILKDIDGNADKALDMLASSFSVFQPRGRASYLEDAAQKMKRN